MTENTVWIDCDNGNTVEVKEGQPLMDKEGVFVWESCGYAIFAWWPRRCRNGRVRWLKWVDRHRDGTYTLSKDQSWL